MFARTLSFGVLFFLVVDIGPEKGRVKAKNLCTKLRSKQVRIFFQGIFKHGDRLHFIESDRYYSSPLPTEKPAWMTPMVTLSASEDFSRVPMFNCMRSNQNINEIAIINFYKEKKLVDKDVDIFYQRYLNNPNVWQEDMYTFNFKKQTSAELGLFQIKRMKKLSAPAANVKVSAHILDQTNTRGYFVMRQRDWDHRISFQSIDSTGHDGIPLEPQIFDGKIFFTVAGSPGGYSLFEGLPNGFIHDGFIFAFDPVRLMVIIFKDFYSQTHAIEDAHPVEYTEIPFKDFFNCGSTVGRMFDHSVNADSTRYSFQFIIYFALCAVLFFSCILALGRYFLLHKGDGSKFGDGSSPGQTKTFSVSKSPDFSTQLKPLPSTGTLTFLEKYKVDWNHGEMKSVSTDSESYSANRTKTTTAKITGSLTPVVKPKGKGVTKILPPLQKAKMKVKLAKEAVKETVKQSLLKKVQPPVSSALEVTKIALKIKKAMSPAKIQDLPEPSKVKLEILPEKLTVKKLASSTLPK